MAVRNISSTCTLGLGFLEKPLEYYHKFVVVFTHFPCGAKVFRKFSVISNRSGTLLVEGERGEESVAKIPDVPFGRGDGYLEVGGK
jgi:hypothetical protein